MVGYMTRINVKTPFIFTVGYIDNLPVSQNTMPKLFADNSALIIYELLFSKIKACRILSFRTSQNG